MVLKLVKTHAYTTPGGCALLVTPDEADKLYRLPLWAFRLFTSLILCADFKSGHGQTGYPELLSLLTPDQPERGPRHWVPSRDDVKNMLRRFVECGLIARDKAASEARGNIIFHMQPRVWQSVSSEIATRKLTRGSSAQNADEQRPKRARKGKTYPETYPHLQDPSSLTPYPLKPGNLSTGNDGATNPAEGEKLGPPGGHTHAPDGARPPPEAQTDTGEGVRVGDQQGPPGGLTDAPAGARPPWAEQGDGWRIGPPLPIHARGVDMTDPANWARDDQGRLIRPVGHGAYGKPTMYVRDEQDAARLAAAGGLQRMRLS